RDVSAIMNVCLAGLTVIALLGILAAPLIARFYSTSLTGAEAEAQQRAITTLLWFFLPQIPLYGLYFLGSAFLNVRKRFVLPMFTPIVNNLVLIGALVIFAVLYGNVDLESVTTAQLALLGLGTTLSVAPMGMLLLPSLRRLGFRWEWRFDRLLWRRVARLSGYAVGFVAAIQIGFLAVQKIANESQGAFTAYTAAFTFFLLPVGLFVWSITTVLAPSLSRTAMKPRREGMADVLSLALRSTLFLVVPCAAGFLVLAHPVVEVMLERGVVTTRSTELVVAILSFLVLGLVQFSLFQVLMRASYAMQDARSPFVVNAIVIAVNIALNVAMFTWIGPEGLAAGHALAYTLAIFLQGRIVARELPDLNLARIGRSAGRVLVAAGAMAALVFGLARLVEDFTGIAQIAAVTGLVAVGGVSYLWFASLLRVEEMQFVRDLVGDRFGRTRTG
ncbi:MAG: polysaccharide biosynthesis C-terminal domain-containing protein, partial [Actinomycetota bacterium]|nr:polysaccharide biosynthesis C-terminal domain-containing protein [Actinomycetota bacterium]